MVLDEHRLAIPDYPGNNLTDSLRNIVANPHVGLIFLVPGRDETIRVDGDAWVTTDPDVLARCAAQPGRGGRRRAKSAIGVRVTSVFFHCPASFQRATLWDSGLVARRRRHRVRRLRPGLAARGAVARLGTLTQASSRGPLTCSG